ncbi:MAG: gliding motility-associated C-terminal domain-containing protein, partial [Saprospiraceae bacterium]
NPDDFTYQWSPASLIVSGGNTRNPIFKIKKDETLQVKVTKKSSGCSQSLDIPARAGQPIVVDVDAVPDLTIFEGQSVKLHIKDGLQGELYLWSTGAKTDTITVAPITTTAYQVTVTDINGCTGIDEVTVTVRTAKCDETDVYIPKAFSPNGDNNNDIFRVRSNFIDEMELIIYNRWGQEVFRTTDKNIGWDGTFKGKELSPDSYAFYLYVLCINTEEYKTRGNVTLLR